MSEPRFIQILSNPHAVGLYALDEAGRIWVLRERDNSREIAWHEIDAERVPYTEWKPLADGERKRNG